LYPPSTQTHRRREPRTLDTATRYDDRILVSSERQGCAGPKVTRETREAMLNKAGCRRVQEGVPLDQRPS